MHSQLYNAEAFPMLSSDYLQEKSAISDVAVYQAKLLPLTLKLSAEFSSYFEAFLSSITALSI